MRDPLVTVHEHPHDHVHPDHEAVEALGSRPVPPAPLGVPRLLQEVWLAPRNAAIAVMHGYRRVVSPLYGDVCRYYPSCSRYAVEAFQRQGLLAGIALTGWRLLRCNPFTRGGIDDAPARRRPRFFINTRGFVRPAV